MNVRALALGAPALLVTGTLTTSSFAEEPQGPKLLLDIQLLDAPFAADAAQSRANRRTGTEAAEGANIQAGDWLGYLESPSMSQIVHTTTAFYSAVDYGIARGWNLVFDPNGTRSERVWGHVVKEVSAAGVFVATTKLPFAAGWAHEEFHRCTWIPHGVSSYNTIWDLDDLSPAAQTYVGALSDEDLAHFKRVDPAGFIRMGAAGIEAQYLISEQTQLEDFRADTQLPQLAMYWFHALASIDYVNRASSAKTIDEHAENYNTEEDPLARDFTGNDFTAWVYDLHRPDEAYEDRGIHPSGFGIDRYRDYDDLTPEMLSYVERMGRKQWLNLVNPFHFGFREFRLSPDFAFNAAIRHHLTSFGDDLQLDAYLNIAGRRSVITAHAYGSSEFTLPGLEGQFFFRPRALGGLLLEPQARVMAWVQPKEQRFFANRGQPGGLVSGRIAASNLSFAQPYLELEAKTPGWVAGNPYLGSKLALRVGMQAQF